MAPLKMILCAFFIVTGVTSKPIDLSADENSSKCSESTEANSSEEVVAEDNASQETLQHSGTDVPNAVEPTDAPLPSLDATALPDPETLLPDTSVMPDPETLLPDTSVMPDPGTLQPDTSGGPDLGNPQATDTTALQLMPDDPSHTVLGVDVSQDMPESDPAHDKVNADTVQVLPDMDLSGTVTKKGQATIITTYHGYPKGATPPFPPHISTIPPNFSRAPPAGIPITTGIPVCFTFQFETPEPEPPRGDM